MIQFTLFLEKATRHVFLCVQPFAFATFADQQTAIMALHAFNVRHSNIVACSSNPRSCEFQYYLNFLSGFPVFFFNQVVQMGLYIYYACG